MPNFTVDPNGVYRLIAIPSGDAGAAIDASFGALSAALAAKIAAPAAPAEGQVLEWSGTAWVNKSISGDASLSSSGSLVVTKTNGVAFGTAATANTTAFDPAGAAAACLDLAGTRAMTGNLVIEKDVSTAGFNNGQIQIQSAADSRATFSIGYVANPSNWGADYAYLQTGVAAEGYAVLKLQPAGGGVQLGQLISVADCAVGNIANANKFCTASNSQQQLALGYDPSANCAWMQAVFAGNTFNIPIKIQPEGGDLHLCDGGGQVYAEGSPIAIADSAVAYIDQSHGNDSTGKLGSPIKPFATLSAAWSAASGNIEKIIVAAGTYGDSLLVNQSLRIEATGPVTFTGLWTLSGVTISCNAQSLVTFVDVVGNGTGSAFTIENATFLSGVLSNAGANGSGLQGDGSTGNAGNSGGNITLVNCTCLSTSISVAGGNGAPGVDGVWDGSEWSSPGGAGGNGGSCGALTLINTLLASCAISRQSQGGQAGAGGITTGDSAIGVLVAYISCLDAACSFANNPGADQYRMSDILGSYYSAQN